MIPPFACTGFLNGVHLPLCLGMEVVLFPLIKIHDFSEVLQKVKPSHVISVPSLWERLGNLKSRPKDLSFLRSIVVGGETVTPQCRTAANDLLEQSGSAARLMTAYGLTEISASGTEPAERDLGKPHIYTIYRIFDPGTLDELPAGRQGEICFCGPCVCLGYLGNESATNDLIRTHPDGSRWLHSGDIGYIDDDGVLHFVDRIKRIFVAADGTKISPAEIESVISRCPAVISCRVEGIPDKNYAHGMCPKAYVVYNKALGQNKARGELIRYITRNLPVYLRPVEIEEEKKQKANPKQGKR